MDVPDFSNFSKTIKMDHHPYIETYCDIEYIDDKASFTTDEDKSFFNAMCN